MAFKTLFGVIIGVAFMSTARAEVIEKTVPYTQAGVKLQGYLAYDPAKTSHGAVPGVLVIPEWWGLNDFAKGRARALAELGYVAFAADMYGDGKVTSSTDEAGKLAGQFYGKPLMAERARAGLDELAKVPGVDTKKLAAIGFCFGGSTVQALGYTDAPLKGIVSFHGNPVPPPSGMKGAHATRYLILNGGADPMIKPEARAANEAALETAGVSYQAVVYAGALHAFMNPDADKVGAATGLTGKIGYNPSAATHAWEAMQRFFGEIFGS